MKKKLSKKRGRRSTMPNQKDIWRWLDGDKSRWDGSNSSHQPTIQTNLLDLIRDASVEELDKIGKKLVKLKSNFIVCMLVRHSDISTKYRLCAFRSLAKRRRPDVPNYLTRILKGNNFVMTYTELSMLGPIKLMKIIMSFYKLDNVTWKMDDAELNKLLFPSSLKMPDDVVRVKKRIKRLIHGIGKEEMVAMLVNDEYEKVRGSEEKIKQLFFRGTSGFNHTMISDLEKWCYERRLLTL